MKATIRRRSLTSALAQRPAPRAVAPAESPASTRGRRRGSPPCCGSSSRRFPLVMPTARGDLSHAGAVIALRRKESGGGALRDLDLLGLGAVVRRRHGKRGYGPADVEGSPGRGNATAAGNVGAISAAASLPSRPGRGWSRPHLAAAVGERTSCLPSGENMGSRRSWIAGDPLRPSSDHVEVEVAAPGSG